jgi:hypothetical protein
MGAQVCPPCKGAAAHWAAERPDHGVGRLPVAALVRRGRKPPVALFTDKVSATFVDGPDVPLEVALASELSAALWAREAGLGPFGIRGGILTV